MKVRQSHKKPSSRNAPRRRVHRVGKHIQLVTFGGVVAEKRVWDGQTWVEVSDSNMEYLLLKEIFRLRGRLRALERSKRK